jgi:hypothetical protein
LIETIGLLVVFAFTHLAWIKGQFLSGNTAFVRQKCCRATAFVPCA